MNDIKNNFTGILPAIASPCDENDCFLEGKFAELAGYLYENEVNGLYVCGGTGDGFKMHLSERKRATEIAVDVSKKHNGTVITHVGAMSSRDAVELAKHAATAGAHAVSSIPPSSFNHEQLVLYYKDIANNVGIPLFVYYIPMLTGRSISLDEMLELLDIEGVAGLKLTDSNLFFMKRLLINRPDITVFSGGDEFLCPALMYGAHGGIGMWYNLFPGIFVDTYRHIQNADIDKAMELQNKLINFCELAWEYGLVSVFEYLMRQRGFAPHCFRKPRTILSEKVIAEMEPLLMQKIAAIESATI
jgi:N-acetylneuraminate lyase